MKFQLTVLGSSSAVPTSDRYPSAQVLNVQERYFLIDCGEGTQIQIRRNRIRFAKINHIFISHLHGDHFFGIFGVISTMGLLGRKNDLNIYGPKELEELLNFYSKITNEKMDFKINFHSLNYKNKELIFEDKIITVESIPLKHRIPTCGFLFKEKERPDKIKKELIEFYKIPVKEIFEIKMGADFITDDGKIIPHNQLTIKASVPRSFAYCSDTVYYKNIAKEIENVDLLYHEATFTKDLEKQALASMHSTASQAAEIALKAKAGKLIIGHYSSRYRSLTPLLNEAREVFPNTVLAIENKVYTID